MDYNPTINIIPYNYVMCSNIRTYHLSCARFIDTNLHILQVFFVQCTLQMEHRVACSIIWLLPVGCVCVSLCFCFCLLPSDLSLHIFFYSSLPSPFHPSILIPLPSSFSLPSYLNIFRSLSFPIPPTIGGYLYSTHSPPT